MKQSRWLLTRLAIALGVVLVGTGFTSGSAQAAQTICPERTFTQSMPVAPRNFASVADVYVRDDCSLDIRAPRVVPVSQAPVAVQGGSIWGRGTGPHASGDPIATVYIRSWDCCGIQMNALYTTYDWSDNGYVVTASNNQWNTTFYHTEHWPSRGWWLDYQQLYYSAGCNGCFSRTLTGRAGFHYQGVFDPTGLLFYNDYHNTMQGQGNGGYSCTWSVTWRHSAPGWHAQPWCAYGYNGASG
jgi:hypothetical protein